MGRLRTNLGATSNTDGPAWNAAYRLDWGLVVGARLKRLRTARDLRLVDSGRLVPKPGGGTYGATFMFRLERGWTTPSLYVYIRLAEQLGVQPGRLLGEEGFEREHTPEQELILRFVEHLGINDEEALARLARPSDL